MCFQANLDNHFLKMQTEWCNDRPKNEKYAINLPGKDPIAGAIRVEAKRDQTWNKSWRIAKKNLQKEQIIRNFSFSEANKVEGEIRTTDIVTNRGSRFFYAPAISFFSNPLKKLVIPKK